MLGRTAGGLYWLFRYLERAENTARLIEVGERIALTRSRRGDDEWASILATTGCTEGFESVHDELTGANVIDYMLRDRTNPSSVLSTIKAARDDGRMVRTALTREVWEAVNACYLSLTEALARKLALRDVPDVLQLIRDRTAFVRGTMAGTMLRDEVYDFARIGTFLERADYTARLLDVKYYVLLPTAGMVGSDLDNVQWDTILRSLSAESSYRAIHGHEISPREIARFLVFDRRLPRSLAFCYAKLRANLGYLCETYGARSRSMEMVETLNDELGRWTIDKVFARGLHETTQELLGIHARLGRQIETDYRFTG